MDIPTREQPGKMLRIYIGQHDRWERTVAALSGASQDETPLA